MSRRINPKVFKLNLSYTMEEAADAAGVSVGTIRNWVRDGLPALTAQRPFLILGRDLQGYLRQKREAKKAPLADDEFFCLSCKAPRIPDGMLADLTWVSPSRPQLRALCSLCGTECTRLISDRRVPEFAEIFDFGGNNGNDA